MIRVTQLPPGVTPADPWPYPAMPPRPDGCGSWQMVMDMTGAMALRPYSPSLPYRLGLQRVWAGAPRTLEMFLETYCLLKHERDRERFPFDEGNSWQFPWVSGTVAQVCVASQMMAAYTDFTVLSRLVHRQQAALRIGEEFGERIAAAVEAARGACGGPLIHVDQGPAVRDRGRGPIEPSNQDSSWA